MKKITPAMVDAICSDWSAMTKGVPQGIEVDKEIGTLLLKAVFCDGKTSERYMKKLKRLSQQRRAENPNINPLFKVLD